MTQLSRPSGGLSGRARQSPSPQRVITLTVTMPSEVNAQSLPTAESLERGVDMAYERLQSCQVGDSGISVVVAVVDEAGNPVDVRSATEKKIRLNYPDGTSVDVEAAFVTDGGDGLLSYAFEPEDLEFAGQMRAQGFVTLDGVSRPTSVSAFQVLDGLPTPEP